MAAYQCAANPRCPNVVHWGPMCAFHGKVRYGVEVKPSTLGKHAGNGLFWWDNRPLQIGEQVADAYGGEYMTYEEGKARYPNFDAHYMVQLKRDLYLDGADKHSSFVRFCNHKPHSRANARMVFNYLAKPPTMRVVAKQTIRQTDEIFIDYGPYFKVPKALAAKAAPAAAPARSPSPDPGDGAPPYEPPLAPPAPPAPKAAPAYGRGRRSHAAADAAIAALMKEENKHRRSKEDYRGGKPRRK